MTEFQVTPITVYQRIAAWGEGSLPQKRTRERERGREEGGSGGREKRVRALLNKGHQTKIPTNKKKPRNFFLWGQRKNEKGITDTGLVQGMWIRDIPVCSAGLVLLPASPTLSFNGRALTLEWPLEALYFEVTSKLPQSCLLLCLPVQSQSSSRTLSIPAQLNRSRSCRQLILASG